MLVFYFFNFLLWNNVGYVMLSVYKLVLAPSDLLACGLFKFESVLEYLTRVQQYLADVNWKCFIKALARGRGGSSKDNSAKVNLNFCSLRKFIKACISIIEVTHSIENLFCLSVSSVM